jgi:hypothetical protein
MTSLELGPEAARTFFRHMAVLEYELSYFRSFIAASVRLLGLIPTTYVKMAPRGWELVFKSSGTLRSLERERSHARLEYTQIPELCVRNELWLESVRSSFHSAFDLAQCPGRVEWDELNLNERRAVFLFSWD